MVSFYLVLIFLFNIVNGSQSLIIKHRTAISRPPNGTLTIIYPRFWLQEELPAGVDAPLDVVTVPVDSDPDVHDVINYSIAGCSPHGCRNHFRIDATSGTLKVVKPLDRDAPGGNKTWRVVVTATQGKHAKASVAIYINLKDINDNLPRFRSRDGHFEAHVAENGRLGEVLKEVDVEDCDEGKNAAFDLNITNAWAVPTLKGFERRTRSTPKALVHVAPSLFALQKRHNGLNRDGFSPDGSNRDGLSRDGFGRDSFSLVSQKCLDREEFSKFLIEIEARDFEGNATRTNYTVAVLDVNDCNVTFTRRAYHFRLRHDGKLGDDVIEVMDDDDPDVSRFYFYLRGNGSKAFELVTSGPLARLRTNNGTSRWRRDAQRHFRFVVGVTDGLHEDEVDIRVTIVDADEDNVIADPLVQIAVGIPVAALLVLLLLFLVLLLLHRRQIPDEEGEDMVNSWQGRTFWENNTGYDEECCAEEDNFTYDIKELQIPIEQSPSPLVEPPTFDEEEEGRFSINRCSQIIAARVQTAGSSDFFSDSPRIFMLEGALPSPASSLSSIVSSASSADLDMVLRFGPKFDPLAELIFEDDETFFR